MLFGVAARLRPYGGYKISVMPAKAGTHLLTLMHAPTEEAHDGAPLARGVTIESYANAAFNSFFV
jgi:hypothetical protein